MGIIKFSQTYRPDGEEYEKVAMWNRFLRKKTELLLIFAPAVLCIITLALGYFSIILAPVYAFFIAYPLIAYMQFKRTIKRHLRNRRQSDNSVCEINIMNNGILVTNEEFEIRELHKWDNISKAYDKFGFYIFYDNKKMVAILRKADIPDEIKDDAFNLIKTNLTDGKLVLA